MSDRAAAVALLRSHLARVAPVRAAPLVRLPVGNELLDGVIDGWPRPGLSEICGPAGSGRIELLLPAMQALTLSEQRVAIVDPVGWLNPPGLRGVLLDQLVMVRPGATRAPWAAEQLLRCGVFPLVILLDPGPLARAGRRLQHAAEQGDAGLCVLSESLDPSLPAALRLELLAGGRLRVRKGAPRHAGRELRWRDAPVPPSPISSGRPALRPL
jgi:hypothetical protein